MLHSFTRMYRMWTPTRHVIVGNPIPKPAAVILPPRSYRQTLTVNLRVHSFQPETSAASSSPSFPNKGFKMASTRSTNNLLISLTSLEKALHMIFFLPDLHLSDAGVKVVIPKGAGSC